MRTGLVLWRKATPVRIMKAMKTLLVTLLLMLALGFGAAFTLEGEPPSEPVAPAAATAALAQVAANAAQAVAAGHPERPAQAQPLLDALKAELGIHRRLIVLFADEAHLQGPAREAALQLGHRLHHDDRDLVHQLNLALLKLAAQPPVQRDPVVAALLDWLEKDPGLLELDRLAFRDPLRILQHGLAPDASPEGAVLKARIVSELAEVDRVEHWVDTEYRQVFGGPGQPAKGGSRVRWDAYVRALKALVPAETPAPAQPQPAEGEVKGGPGKELSGRELPAKVLVLSFDDGPHRLYTPEILAILQRYHAPAVFFEVGRNLGSVDAAGGVKLGPLAPLAEDLSKAGLRVGNHSYTHAQLSKETGAPLDLEIRETDQLLKAIPGAHSHLFRFPYGARTTVQLQAIRAYGLRSVLWNIDSMDWADPVPSSVADRVVHAIEQEHRGIILFHDIHDRAGKVLPALLERLRAEGYRFAGLDADGELLLP